MVILLYYRCYSTKPLVGSSVFVELMNMFSSFAESMNAQNALKGHGRAGWVYTNFLERCAIDSFLFETLRDTKVQLIAEYLNSVNSFT